MTVIADELQQYAALQIVKIGLDKLCDLSLKSPDMYITDLCMELEKLISEIEYINGWEQLK
ncbi:hypothetical protein P7H38_07490 [Lactococcus raffinolactis]|uniref:hypothetical protein n=1 Tax=Pseudolactococcus raffinolactis TaxID=1366 RepID=UPI001436BEB0|nr:hypothetical protein [Lactococcus raffinolactis]MDN5441006.1 hypothetical protein [Lactococcus lactis]MDN5446580.1 hypothetical protein [Lactococcus lactis]MDN5474307.1 hypothetical protein [Lactococcus lactis]MDT2766526.1 hypothetical protein [Lactococcus raffinolactis]MDT2789686.1 hypothetical protein [Lactococcus raffinolactis]